ncbi:hypothetical protein OsI_36185 [Oryza sativa Indica Group]|uniref:Uncharacterized protein n=1 Tax=Oryza sativa subsp. indica TaxID=39946 RepID=B8BKM0_ORYSI|nr:hypothetical protein OsI_36185 [Oryza sativa Indica Group]
MEDDGGSHPRDGARRASTFIRLLTSFYSYLPIDDHQHPLIIGKISTYATSAGASRCSAEGRFQHIYASCVRVDHVIVELRPESCTHGGTHEGRRHG